jgi:polyphosphate kinase
MTLYRAGERSGIADALMRAAEAGKDVAVFVEVKARFDERQNVRWAKRLEDAGVHVVHGLLGVKNHAKTALVVRREGPVARGYVHVGTGNYNGETARFYTDLGLLTAREDVAADVNDLFNALTGSSVPSVHDYRACLVGPSGILPALLRRIEREADHARAGRAARIRIKVNGLADRAVVQALYRASQAGVSVDLVVRGICTLAPGAPGASERIRVVSLLGRFLEHARIIHFENGGEPEYFIGSADLRPRNLRRRVEVLAPVRGAELHAQLDRILELELHDAGAWELAPDGVYTRRRGHDGVRAPSAQAAMMAPRGAPHAWAG